MCGVYVCVCACVHMYTCACVHVCVTVVSVMVKLPVHLVWQMGTVEIFFDIDLNSSALIS